jgi:hypothetical protein
MRPQVATQEQADNEDVEAILQRWQASGRALAHRWKVVATSLDALVRSARRNNTSARYISGRLRDLWYGADDRTLLLGPTELWMSKKEALISEADKGRWILPAYVSGLRALTVREEAVGDDIERLGVELGGLKPEVGRIGIFHDWLWSGGAEGFDTQVDDSPIDALEALPDEDAGESTPTGLPPSTVDAWNELLEAAAAEFDGKTLAREYGGPIDLYMKTAPAVAWTQDGPAADALRAAVPALDAWPLLELEAVLRSPELQQILDPVRFAGHLLSLVRVADRVDRPLLEALAELARGGDPYGEALIAELRGDALGRALGDRLDLRDLDLDFLADHLAAAETATGAGLLNRLVRRAAGEGEALQAVVFLIGRWGISEFLRHVDPSVVPATVGATVARTLSESGATIAFVRDFLSRVPPNTAATALVAVPDFLVPMRDLIRDLLTQHPAECAVLVQKILPTSGADVVGEALLASEAAGWTQKMLTLALPALAARPKGDEVVAQLARMRGVEVTTRLLALDALKQRPALLAETVKWRPTDVMEPPEIKERLQELRKAGGR